MSWTQTLNETGLKAGKYLTKTFHAMQDIPAQHRLLNACVMGLGWLGGDYLRQIIFAQKHDGTEVKREDVPAPLQFMHGLVELNQCGDDPANRWKETVFELFPAVGAGLGAYYGSQLAFERNGREQAYESLKNKKTLGIMEADNAAAYAASKPLRVLSGLFGIFSAASGLTAVYGLFLNGAFVTAANRTIFPGQAKSAYGPAVAVKEHVSDLEKYVLHAAKHDGKIPKEWAEKFARNVITPLFPNQSEPEIRKMLQEMVQQSFAKAKAANVSPEAIEKAVVDDIRKIFEDKQIPKTLVQLGIPAKEIRNAKLGNAVPIFSKPIQEIENLFSKVTGKKSRFQHIKERYQAGLDQAGVSL